MSIAALFAILAQAATPVSALPPSGKWIVEGENNMCALLHGYGAEQPDVTFGIRPWPIGGGIDILLFTKSRDAAPADGTAHLAIGMAAPSDTTYQSFSIAGQHRRLATFSFLGKSAEDFASAKQVTITLDRGRPIILSMPETKGAFAALASCNDLLLKSLGIDPGWGRKVAKVAVPLTPKQSWFTADDYPQDAIQGGAQGTSSLLFTIDVDGRVSHCSNFGSAGNADIDAAACQAVKRRGRYRPARDAQGQPVVSYDIMRTRWHIPL